ncbi:MAG: acyl-CoA dehydrogenase [Polyangiaceae bacterium]|nr:acyl-CoA dehydrogenase [Polyangiaceae bacterium]
MRFAGFSMSEEETLLARTAAEFAMRRLLPGAAERDRTGAFPTDEVLELGRMGMLAMKVTEADGGAGTSNVGYVLAMQALARACASTAVVVASSNLVGKILAEHATEAQRERWLGPFVRGELGPASFALTEPKGGSDAAAISTRARLDGDAWVLDGEKAWITSGTGAAFHLVFARTDGEGRDGISCFIVERGTPGLVIGREEDKMGQRASGTTTLALESCRVPVDCLLGARGAGYSIALSALGAGRVGIAALSLGIAEAAFDAGCGYAESRVVFGKALTEFQNSQFVLADTRTELDAAWLLTLRAARALDEGERAGAETSMAKLYATEACGRAVDRMVQLHGGYGYSREYPIERLYRDARVTRIYEGTSEIQRLVIAREIIRRAR